MRYKIIEKSKRGNIIVRGKGIGVQKNTIAFHRGFVLTYGPKKYVEFAENENGCLCLRMTDKKGINSYNVTTQKQGTQVVHTPTILKNRICEYGKYEVTQDGEWFVTGCKLN